MLSASDLLLGAAPCVAWLAWIRRKDDHEPEPWRLVYLVFLLGCFAAVAQVMLRPRIEYAMLMLAGDSLRAAHLLDAFVVTALCEEALKLLAFLPLALLHHEWDEPVDGLVYGAAAGLGFAAVENAFFVAIHGDVSLVVTRGFTATLAHVAFSGGLGFCLGMARLRGRRTFALWLPLGLLYAVLMHGAYDALLLTESTARGTLLIAMPLLFIGFALRLRWARRRSPQYHP
jgi:RsiW-degrading membrane proteinase PrsW (M82 family)